jgi:hypothetical protein
MQLQATWNLQQTTYILLSSRALLVRCNNEPLFVMALGVQASAASISSCSGRHKIQLLQQH